MTHPWGAVDALGEYEFFMRGIYFERNIGAA
jgi:hypothetical protein